VVVKKALTLFKEIQEERKRCETEDDMMKLLEFIQLRDKDFALSFPMVLRIMVLEGDFSARAFKRFCRAIRSKPMRGHAEYLSLQVSYMALLWRKNNPHGDERELRLLRADWLGQLERERDDFENKYKEAEKEVEETFKRVEQERRESLIEVAERAARESSVDDDGEGNIENLEDIEDYDLADDIADDILFGEMKDEVEPITALSRDADADADADADSAADTADADADAADTADAGEQLSAMELLQELLEAEREMFGESIHSIEQRAGDADGADASGADAASDTNASDADASDADASDADVDDEPPELEGEASVAPSTSNTSGASSATSRLRERIGEFAEHEQRKRELGMDMQPLMQTKQVKN